MSNVIRLNINELRSVISEKVHYILEAALNPQQSLVDNFDLVARLMEFKSDDDFYTFLSNRANIGKIIL